MLEQEKIKITGDGSVTFFNADFKEHYHSLEGAREEAVAKYIVPSELKRRFKDGGDDSTDYSNHSNLIFQRGKPVGDTLDASIKFGKPVGDTLDASVKLGKPVCDTLDASIKFGKPVGYEQDVTDVSILDICFGLGYNTLLAGDEAAKWRGSISVTALEIDRDVVGDASRSIDEKWRAVLADLYKDSLYSSDYLNVEMIWGDARMSCSDLIADERQFDLIYHDPFSTQRNAQLWTVDFFKKLYLLLKPDGLLLTYSTALPVLVGFLEAGFCIGKSEQVGEQRGGTVVAKCADMIKYPYSDDEMLDITESAKAIPYRDLSQKGINGEILRERNEKVVIRRQNDYMTK